jgi:hypothetical protein
MSTRATFGLLGQFDDPREVELVRSLIEKTRQGKIPWTKQANALTATIPNGLQINFVLGPLTILAAYPNWQLLTVRDKAGNELLKVTNGSIASILNASTGVLLTVADELFKIVNGAASDDLDRAINTIKKL